MIINFNKDYKIWNIADEKTKYIVFGTGGTLMTISFPLFCFGANNKRNAYYNQMILNSKK